MEFSRPEYWGEWPFPSPGDLPNPGIKPGSPALQVDSLPAELSEKPSPTHCSLLFIDSASLHCSRLLHWFHTYILPKQTLQKAQGPTVKKEF